MAKIRKEQIAGLDEHISGLIAAAIADQHIEKIGYQGVLPTSAPEGGIKGGMEFAVGTALTGTSQVASVGDYLIAKEDFTYTKLPTSEADIDTFLAHFVIVEGNIKNVSGGNAESGKYVSGLTLNNGVMTVSKETLPVQGVNTTNTAGTGKTTKAVVGITLVGNQVKATEKDIDLKAYPQAVETLTVSNGSATLSHTPAGAVQVMLNGIAQTMGTDYTVSGTAVTINAAMGWQSGDTVTAIYNYEN